MNPTMSQECETTRWLPDIDHISAPALRRQSMHSTHNDLPLDQVG